MSIPTPNEDQTKAKSGIKREFYIKIAVEVFSVVLAVLLALGVDEWRENRKNEKLAMQAELKIKKEISYNIDILEGLVEDYEKSITEIDSLLKQAEKGEIIVSNSHTIFSPIFTTVWETIKFTKAINYIDLDTVLLYSSYYMIFNIYQEKVSIYINKIPEDHGGKEGKVEKLRRKKETYEDILRVATQIIAHYKTNEEELKVEDEEKGLIFGKASEE